MKISTIVLLLIPITTFAQNYQGMNEEDMQKMMQPMLMMQSCMEDIDKTDMKALEKRSNQFQAEVKSLCASGKRDEAQAKAISFGKEMMEEPAMQTMRKCGEMMEGMMPKTPFMDQHEDDSDQHVCDSGAGNKDGIN